MRSQTGDWLSVSVLAVIVMLKTDGWKWTIFENPELWHWGFGWVGGGRGAAALAVRSAPLCEFSGRSSFRKSRFTLAVRSAPLCEFSGRSSFRKSRFTLAVRVSTTMWFPGKTSFRKLSNLNWQSESASVCWSQERALSQNWDLQFVWLV